MIRLDLPVAVGDKPIGSVRVEHHELVAMLGEPNLESRDPYQFPGPVEIWAVQCDDLSKIVVEFHLHLHEALLYSSSPDLDQTVKNLGIDPAQIVWRG